ncbi:MAG: hypothetical protein HRT87_10050 [Legionellales bacterium]|nr:hypothetical protein [Legionellales bacterium]
MKNYKKIVLIVSGLLGCGNIFAEIDFDSYGSSFVKQLKKEAEETHVKGDVSNPGIVKHFIGDELFEARFRGSFDLKKFYRLVPVVLRLKEVPQTIIKEIQQMQDWAVSGVSSCYINGWASYKPSMSGYDTSIPLFNKKVYIEIDSIVCKHDKLEFFYGDGWDWVVSKSSKIKADISGEILGVDFKKGVSLKNIKDDSHYGYYGSKISKIDEEVLVKFTKMVDANMDKQEKK